MWATARALTDGADGDAFAELVRRIDGSPWHPLGTAEVFCDGHLALRAVLTQIASAQEEVLVETYILRDDDIGQELADALADAVRRGVRVALLADAVGSLWTGRAYWRALRQAGVSVRLFHPWWGAPSKAWRRDHRKLVIVDRCVAYTGGMNIGEEYGLAVRGTDAPWRDTFARVAGPVALELAAVFAEGWDRAGGDPLPGLENVRWAPGAGATPERLGRPPETLPAERVLVLDARPGRGQPETIAVLAALVGAARERLWITNPYFAPPSGALTILTDAAARGVDVRLLLPGRSDVPLLRHAAHGTYARLLAGGVRIFEYTGAVLHAKTMVVDAHVAVVGSSNLDFRSLWFNAECNLLVRDAGVAATLASHFVDALAEAEEITPEAWARRGWLHATGDTVARWLRLLL